jgi:hypothetical protein
MGTAFVWSERPGAAILAADGTPTGVRTNALLEELPVGAYRLGLELAGHRRRMLEVQIGTRPPVRAGAVLVPQSGRLSVAGTPEGFEVEVAGEGAAPDLAPTH